MNKMADTGDLILFKGKTFGSKFQRAFTRGDYDHVSFVLRCTEDEIVLFESTSNNRVGLISWDKFV